MVLAVTLSFFFVSYFLCTLYCCVSFFGFSTYAKAEFKSNKKPSKNREVLHYNPLMLLKLGFKPSRGQIM
jgi:hypothetical protein